MVINSLDETCAKPGVWTVKPLDENNRFYVDSELKRTSYSMHMLQDHFICKSKTTKVTPRLFWDAKLA